MSVELKATIADEPVGKAEFKMDSSLSLEQGGDVGLGASIGSDTSLAAEIKKSPKVKLGMEYGVPVGLSGSYEPLTDKPKIEGVELIGNRTFAELGLVELTNEQIMDIWNTVNGSL